jgi:indole-3-glycerol phosphate synthase
VGTHIDSTYLGKIVAWHRNRAQAEGYHDPAVITALRAEVQQRLLTDPLRGFIAAVAGPQLSVIAEIKRRSPSKGPLAADLDPATTAREYAQGGASCLSVLTDAEHFGGSTADLRLARRSVGVPVIRKDFTVCEADVLQATAMGADCVLFIVAALSEDELSRFAATASDIGIDVLWETHDEAEVEIALRHGAQMIGVNQRDLHTFQVDQQRAVRVGATIPSTVVRVAESGVRGPEDAAALRAAGFDAILVGESIVTSGDRSTAVRALIESSRTQ